jgi:hypothetical protein
MTRFESGAIIIPVSQPNASAEQVHAIVNQVAREDGISIFPVSTGLTESGPDLGSPSAKILELPRVALISGPGTNAYQVGETWFLLNERMGIPVSLIDLSQIEGLKLTEYNTIVLPSGSYGDLSEETVRRIRDWIQSGGMLIALHRAVQWVLDTELVGETFKEFEPVSPLVPYGEVEKSRSAQRISGAIFEVKLDVTHPIAFGHSMLGAVFRSHALFLESSKTPGANVALYTDEPLLSGYVSTENLKNLKGGASIIARKMGSGSVVLFVDNPNFRAIWHGTSSLFLNALFFGRSL